MFSSGLTFNIGCTNYNHIHRLPSNSSGHHSRRGDSFEQHFLRDGIDDGFLARAGEILDRETRRRSPDERYRQASASAGINYIPIARRSSRSHGDRWHRATHLAWDDRMDRRASGGGGGLLGHQGPRRSYGGTPGSDHGAGREGSGQRPMCREDLGPDFDGSNKRRDDGSWSSDGGRSSGSARRPSGFPAGSEHAFPSRSDRDSRRGYSVGSHSGSSDRDGYGDGGSSGGGSYRSSRHGNNRPRGWRW